MDENFGNQNIHRNILRLRKAEPEYLYDSPKAKKLTTNNMLFAYKLSLLGFEWAILQSLMTES